MFRAGKCQKMADPEGRIPYKKETSRSSSKSATKIKKFYYFALQHGLSIKKKGLAGFNYLIIIQNLLQKQHEPWIIRNKFPGT